MLTEEEPVQIDELAVEDWHRLRRIRLRALEDAPDAFASTYEQHLSRSEADWRRDFDSIVAYVARVGGDEVGRAVDGEDVAGEEDVGIVRGCRDSDRENSAWLLSMWVDPKVRGAGAGDALVDRVIRWAREGGFEQLLLEVGDDNLHAQALYLRHGFVPTGERGTLPPPREHIGEHRMSLTL